MRGILIEGRTNSLHGIFVGHGEVTPRHVF